MNTLQDVVLASQEFDQGKGEDYTVQRTDLEMSSDGWVSIPGSSLFGRDYFKLEDRAWLSLAQKLAIPADYLKRCPPALRAKNANHWFSQPLARRENKWFIRTMKPEGDDPGPGGIRAILSEEYSPIANTMITKILRDVVEAGGNSAYKLIRPWVSRDSINLKVTVADTEGGNYGIGFAFGNDEVGEGSLFVTPFIQRHSCTNSIVWNKQALRLPHRWRSEEYLVNQVRIFTAQSVNHAPRMINAMLQAETQELPNFMDVVAKVIKDNKLEKLQGNIYAGTEGQNTLAGLVNGLSFAAHKQADMEEGDRLALEFLAGAFLMGDKKVPVLE